MRNLQLKWIPLTLALLFVSVVSLSAQEDGSSSKSKKPEKHNSGGFAAHLDKYAKRKAKSQKYTLKYRFEKGEVLRWKHDHRIVNETKFGTEAVDTSTRAQPEYSWTVQSVDSRGTQRFEIMMERIKVWEQNGTADQVHYDSAKDKKAPESCVIYHERVGRPSATYAISANGQIVESKSNYVQIPIGGVGENPVIAFPDGPIPVGKKWNVTHVVKPKDKYGTVQQLQVRVQYTLEKVVDGEAHITFVTNVLTPMTDETLRSQIVTHLMRGFAIFDIAKGKLSYRETSWDERIIGYRGPESYMHYKANRRETLVVPEPKVATVSFEEPAKKEKPATSLLQPMKGDGK